MAIREFADRALPDDLAHRVVEAGRHTASASNKQPWHFVLVRDRDNLRKLGALMRTGPYTASAAAAVIVAYEKTSGEIGDTYEVLVVVPLGYPKRKVVGKKKRKALSEVASAERFGTPLS